MMMPAMFAWQAPDYMGAKIRRSWKHTASLLGCRFSPGGDRVAAGAADASVQLWRLGDDQHASGQGHETWVRCVGFSTDGSTIYSAGYDGNLCWWDADAFTAEQAAPRLQISAHEGWVRWLEVHPSGQWIATGGNDCQVRLWDAASGKLVRSFAGHEKHVYSLLFDPTGETLLSGDLAGVVRQWDVRTGKEMRVLDAAPLHTYHGGQQVDYGGVRCMALSHDLKWLACGGLHKATNPFAGVQEPLVLVLDWETGQLIRTHEMTGVPRGLIWRLVYQPDGVLIGACGGDMGFLAFWQEDKAEFHKLKMPSPVLDCDQSRSDPHQIVASDFDGNLHLIELPPASA
ncbi:MAG: WD40 repeat domain-containing protein [Planctomycetota bacterium]|nr:MAG: WD40 repeat domain-containing protein [Planctomycetota bacterium]